jgi:hypothetical protein
VVTHVHRLPRDVLPAPPPRTGGRDEALAGVVDSVDLGPGAAVLVPDPAAKGLAGDVTARLTPWSRPLPD